MTITKDSKVLAAQATLDRARADVREKRLEALLKKDRRLVAATKTIRLARRASHTNNLGISKKATRIEVLRKKIADTEAARQAQIDARPNFLQTIAEAVEELEAVKEVIRKEIDPDYVPLEEVGDAVKNRRRHPAAK
jgi:hypothetical protein